MNHTRLWYLNAIVLQWFGVRLVRVMDGEVQTGWTVLFMWPLTGWSFAPSRSVPPRAARLPFRWPLPAWPRSKAST